MMLLSIPSTFVLTVPVKDGDDYSRHLVLLRSLDKPHGRLGRHQRCAKQHVIVYRLPNMARTTLP